MKNRLPVVSDGVAQPTIVRLLSMLKSKPFRCFAAYPASLSNTITLET